ncbi:type A2 lanthipeptide [Gracilibacillus xinjiangensis]|uniref:Lantibiotic n=1 Tax=Gracilibacillus xinjiangensis TaxID=1193282 RepID=A0ABV8WRR8_9BACI
MEKNYVDIISDNELEALVGGDGGLVETLTKDCPDVVSSVCDPWGIFCKNCE